MPVYAENPVIQSIKVNILPESKQIFAEWQANLSNALTRLPGFISLEFLSPQKDQREWLIVLRFMSPEAAKTWKLSPRYQQLVEELKAFSISQDMNDTSADESATNAGVTQMIFAEVHTDKLAAYQDWSSKIHAAEAKFPGFRGVYVQSPAQGNGKHWITLLQFDTTRHLDDWLSSQQRQNLLKEGAVYVQTFESHRVISPYEGWFASIVKVGQIPPAWKQAMLILLVLFPIVMLEFKFLSPLTKDLDISLSTFISNAISVGLLTFPITPLAIKCLGWWLSPPPANATKNTILGTILVLMLYLAEIIIFWNFL